MHVASVVAVEVDRVGSAGVAAGDEAAVPGKVRVVVGTAVLIEVHPEPSGARISDQVAGVHSLLIHSKDTQHRSCSQSRDERMLQEDAAAVTSDDNHL
jgi:hypothetical protein